MLIGLAKSAGQLHPHITTRAKSPEIFLLARLREGLYLPLPLARHLLRTSNANQYGGARPNYCHTAQFCRVEFVRARKGRCPFVCNELYHASMGKGVRYIIG